LALPIAAHLARSRLIAARIAEEPDLANSSTLDIIANALATVAPAFPDYSEVELQGSRSTAGGTVLQLQDGWRLSAVLIKRGDLQHAIAVLTKVGLPGILFTSPSRT